MKLDKLVVFAVSAEMVLECDAFNFVDVVVLL